MRRTHGFLLRFLDLGLLLLMAFLVVAELNPSHQESLPGPVVQVTEATRVYALTFNDEGSMRITWQGRLLCDSSESDRLLSCLRTHPAGRIVLIPTSRATVQQLVTLMDTCEVRSLDCTAGE